MPYSFKEKENRFIKLKDTAYGIISVVKSGVVGNDKSIRAIIHESSAYFLFRFLGFIFEFKIFALEDFTKSKLLISVLDRSEDIVFNENGDRVFSYDESDLKKRNEFLMCEMIG